MPDLVLFYGLLRAKATGLIDRGCLTRFHCCWTPHLTALCSCSTGVQIINRRSLTRTLRPALLEKAAACLPNGTTGTARGRIPREDVWNRADRQRSSTMVALHMAKERSMLTCQVCLTHRCACVTTGEKPPTLLLAISSVPGGSGRTCTLQNHGETFPWVCV